MSALTRPSPDRLTVLLVDDSRPVRAVIRTLLHGLGFARVFEAADGDEAQINFRVAKLQPRWHDVTTHYDPSRFMGLTSDLVSDVDAAAHIVWAYL